MPIIRLFTNLPKSKIPVDFISKMVPVLVECVKKPPERFVCMVSSDCQLSMIGDETSPAMLGTLESVGNLGKTENQYIAEKLSAFIEKELGIPPKRFLLTFYDLKTIDVARNGLLLANTA